MLFRSGWTADQVDYLCDGTDDQVEINAAIMALPDTGGEVVVLDGQYYVTEPILINNKIAPISLSGNGKSTTINRSFNSLTVKREGVITIKNL